MESFLVTLWQTIKKGLAPVAVCSTSLKFFLFNRPLNAKHSSCFNRACLTKAFGLVSCVRQTLFAKTTFKCLPNDLTFVRPGDLLISLFGLVGLLEKKKKREKHLNTQPSFCFCFLNRLF